MKNWVKRAIRTFAQAAVGYLAVALPTISFSEDVSVIKTTLIGVGVSAIAAGLSAMINILDDRKGE